MLFRSEEVRANCQMASSDCAHTHRYYGDYQNPLQEKRVWNVSAEYSDISYRDSIVVVNDDLKLQKRALSDGAGCMILVDVDIISQGIIRMAKEANCTIIKTPLNMFQVARSMYRSPLK